MKKIYSLFIFTLFSFLGTAQDYTPKVITSVQNNLQAQKDRGEIYNTYVGVEGTPFIQDDFVPARLFPDDKPYLVRYNAVDDEFIVKLGDGNLVLDNARRDYKVVLSESGLTYLTLYENGNRMPGYYIEILKTDKISLYKKQVIEYREGRKAADNFSNNQSAYFTKPREFFFAQMQPEGKIIELSKNKRSFAKMFGSNEDAVKKFLSKNKIDLTNGSDLKKVIEYINSL